MILLILQEIITKSYLKIKYRISDKLYLKFMELFMKNAYLFALIFASVLFSLDAVTSDEDTNACEENTIINEKVLQKVLI